MKQNEEYYKGYVLYYEDYNDYFKWSFYSSVGGEPLDSGISANKDIMMKTFRNMTHMAICDEKEMCNKILTVDKFRGFKND